MNKPTNRVEYKAIDNIHDLEEVVGVLEEGYNWGKQQSKILLSEIPKINHDYGLFGVAVYVDDFPKGAQLYIYQGSISVSGKNVDVVNISSWYVDESLRGLPAIKLQQFTVEPLRDSIITSYTTNWVGTEALLRLGFRKMNLKRASVKYYQVLHGLIYLRHHGIRKIKSEDISLPSNYISGFSCDKSFDYFEFKADEKKLKLAGKVVYTNRSFFGVRLKIRTYTIAWTDDEEMLALLWNKIAIKIMLYTRSIKLTYDFQGSNFPVENQEKDMNCLIYGDDKIESVLRFQSELGLF